MIKKFVSMSTAVLLMASGISFIGMTSANASAPSLMTVSNITSSGATADISAFTGTNPQFAIDVRVFAATGATTSVAALQTIQVDNNSVTTVPVTGLTSGTAYRIGIVNRSTHFVYELDSFTTSGSAPAVNLGLSTSSTIKGVSISSLGVGNINPLSVTRGSVTLTSTQAADVSNSGSFVTAFSAVSGSAEVAAINKFARGVTPFYPNGPTSLNYYNGTAALSDGDFFQVVVASISNGGNYLWYIIEVTVTTGGGSTPAPSSSEAEQAAAQAAAAAAAALAAAIAKAKAALSTQFASNKPATLEQFLDADFKIRNSNVAAKVSAAMLKLPAADRDNLQKVNEIIKLEDFLDRVSVLDTRSTVRASELVSRGLLPATSTYKHSVVRGLTSYPNGSLDSLEKIEAAIKEQIFKAEAPKRRLAEIQAKIAARKR